MEHLKSNGLENKNPKVFWKDSEPWCEFEIWSLNVQKSGKSEGLFVRFARYRDLTWFGLNGKYRLAAPV